MPIGSFYKKISGAWELKCTYIAPPIFTGIIPDMQLNIDEEMTPYDASVHFTAGGDIDNYTLQNAPAGITIDSATGIISGTSTEAASNIGLTVTGTNEKDSAVSNVFNMLVINPWDESLQIEIRTPVDNDLFTFYGFGFTDKIDWGDGTIEQAELVTNPTHTYAIAGDYIVKALQCTGLEFDRSIDAEKVIDVHHWGTNFSSLGSTPSLGSGFRGAINLGVKTAGIVSATDTLYTSGNPNRAFQSCTSLVAFSGIMNVAGNMGYWFSGDPVFNDPNINNWEVNTNNSSMISTFNTANAFDQDISAWDMSSVNGMVDFLKNTLISTVNYDLFLIANEAVVFIQAPFNMSMGSSTYTAGGAAEAGRDNFVAQGITVTDGGPA